MIILIEMVVLLLICFPASAWYALVLLQVVEFQSLGVRVRNTKRFFILNPTSITYDFVWAPVLPPAVAALGGPPPPSPFNCVVRKGAISEGR